MYDSLLYTAMYSCFSSVESRSIIPIAVCEYTYFLFCLLTLYIIKIKVLIIIIHNVCNGVITISYYVLRLHVIITL